MAIKKRFPYKAAFVACNGGCRATADCQYGCVGCELCVNACKFEAIALNDYGVAEVNEDKCIACGKCVRECPRELIRIHECANPVVVKCSNRDPGKDARKMCEVSCIGCGICQKLCPPGPSPCRTASLTSMSPSASPAANAPSNAPATPSTTCAAS